MDYKEIFDRYLDGKLSGDELRDFEKSLRDDPELAGELEQYRQLHEASEKIFTRDLTDQQAKDDIRAFKKQDIEKDIDLQQFRKEMDKAGRRRISTLWYAAAVVLVGVMTALIVSLLRSPVELPEMYARYYEEYRQSDKLLEITRSNDDLDIAVQVYASGDYNRAGLLFRQLADSLSFSPYADFYAGLICIHQERWEKAIESFRRVLSAGDSEIKTDAVWYLGLCYLMVDNASAAREQFEKLTATKNEYSKRARKILRHLD